MGPVSPITQVDDLSGKVSEQTVAAIGKIVKEKLTDSTPASAFGARL